MATAAETKTLNQLIKSFEDASSHSKELEKVITNFTDMTKEFRDVLFLLDENISISEVSKLSDEAIQRLSEIKAYNEFEILNKLESVVSKQLNDQLRAMQKQLATQQKENSSKIDQQFKKMTNLVTTTTEGNKTGTNDEHNVELLSFLQRIENQTKNIQFGGPYSGPQTNQEEFTKLRKLVSTLGSKIKKIEEEYEERIAILENEIEILKASSTSSEIDDEDLPF